MAIAFGTIGTAGAGTTSVTPAYPASIAAGDGLLLRVVNKYPTNGPATPSGWTRLGQYTGGSGSAGADAGSVYVTEFWREADGSETGNVTVTVASGNSTLARIIRYTKSASARWGVYLVGGADNTGNGNWSVTADSSVYITAGDLIAVAHGANTDGTTFSTFATTGAGLTIGTTQNRGAASTNQGDDCLLGLRDAAVTSGSATVAPTYTANATGVGTDFPAGASTFVVLREQFDYVETPSETVAVTESIAAVMAATAGISDSVALSESLASTMDAVVAPVETVDLTESASLVFAATVGLSESADLSEECAFTMAAFGELTESVNLAESMAVAGSAGIELLETVGLDEELAGSYAIQLALPETVDLDEDLDTLATYGPVAVAETVAVADVIRARPWVTGYRAGAGPERTHASVARPVASHVASVSILEPD